MDYLNIVIGLGGTGLEIVQDFLKINNRYPINKKNDMEWFVIDTADPQESKEEFKKYYNDPAKRLIKLETFRNADEIVKNIKNDSEESNIDEAFKENGMIRKERCRNDQGAWEKRKLGYLSLLYHIIINQRNNIIRKINTLLSAKELQNYDRINFFFICSIAGGTGSGLLLPLNILLKNLIDDNFEQYNIKFYHLLVTPDAVAQGSRDPKLGEEEESFKANAYQTLKEIDLIVNKEDIEWKVILNSTTSLKYNNSMGKLIDKVFLFNDKNISNCMLSSSASKDDAYKPIFQLVAWSLFLLNSIDTVMYSRVGNILEMKPNSPFVGIGTYIIEYPAIDILSKCANKLLSDCDHFANFRNIDNAKIESNINNFKLPFKDLEQNIFTPQIMKKNQNDFLREMNAYSDKSQKDNLISLEPRIEFPDTVEYNNEFEQQLNKEIEYILKNEKYTTNDIIHYLNCLKRRIAAEKNTYIKKKNTSQRQIKNYEDQIISIRKIKKIKKIKGGSYFNAKYKIEAYKILLNLIEKNNKHISKMINYFEDFLKVFKLSNYLDHSKYLEEQESYFEYLPLERTYEDLDNISDQIIDNLYQKKQKEHLENHEHKLHRDELNNKILVEVWISFSESLSDYIANKVHKYITTRTKNIKEKELIDKYEEYLIEFLRKKKIFRDHNNIVEKVNNGEIESSLKYADPYIKVSGLRASDNYPFIASSNNNKNNINTDQLCDFSGAETFPVIDDEKIIIFSKLTRNNSLSDLEIDDYKNYYFGKLKKNTNWYKYLDPCFEEVED